MRRYLNLLMLTACTVVAYAAAVNRSRPPVLLLASFLAALLLLAVFLPRLTLRKLELRRTAQQEAHVGQSLALEVSVRNRGWLPRFMVHATDVWRCGTPDKPSGHVQEFPLGLLPVIRGRSSYEFTTTRTCTRRGLWQLGPAMLDCSFPLGLVESRREDGSPPQELLVYPHVFDVKTLPLFGSSLETNRADLALRVLNGAEDFKGIREYRPGDPPKHMHWKASARHSRLLIKEFEPTAAARLCIALDLHALSDVGLDERTTTEVAISIAASLACFAAEHGLPTRIATTTEEPPAPDVDAAQRGTPGYKALLAWFALLSANRQVPYWEVLAETQAASHIGETIVAFVSSSDEHLDRVIGALASMKDAGCEPVVFVLDRASFTALSDNRADEVREQLRCLGIPAETVKRETSLPGLFA